jgi:putative SOS response-associated peptidase YedK
MPEKRKQNDVVLDRSEWAAWLDPHSPENDLLKPSPPGSLKVQKVERALGNKRRSKWHF